MTRNIPDNEIRIIKAMLASGGFTKDQIISYFTRPDRTVNVLRVHEILNGKFGADLPPATPAELANFLQTFSQIRMPNFHLADLDPLSDMVLSQFVKLQPGSTNILDLRESETIEFKEQIQFSNEYKGRYGRTVAAMSNNSGGYILFGVRDTTAEVLGINGTKFDQYDDSKLSNFFGKHLEPAPSWSKRTFNIAGKTIGVLHIRESLKKPIICRQTSSGNELAESEIYYRYPAETRRIQYAELSAILAERNRMIQEQTASLVTKLVEAGPESAAVLDLESGKISGASGSLLIDESLLEKVSFIREGAFSEKSGTPTLKLVGSVQPVSLSGVNETEAITRPHNITDADLFSEFLEQRTVTYPREYLRRAAYSQKSWLPLFYFIRQAQMTVDESIALLQAQPDCSTSHIEAISNKLRAMSRPAARPNRQTSAETRTKIIARSVAIPETEEGWYKLLKAIRSLEQDELNKDYVLNLLKQARNAELEKRNRDLLRYAVVDVDVMLHAAARIE